MLELLVLTLVILWILGYVRIESFPLPDIELFSINGRVITLWNLLIFFVIFTILGILPSPFREIAAVIFLLWVLSILGIIAISGLSSVLVITIILGLILYIFAWIPYHT